MLFLDYILNKHHRFSFISNCGARLTNKKLQNKLQSNLSELQQQNKNDDNHKEPYKDGP